MLMIKYLNYCYLIAYEPTAVEWLNSGIDK